MPTININSLTPGSQIYVKGIVDFSRIASRLEDEELAADNQRKLTKGLKPTDAPHTRLSITNAEVVYADPAHPTLAEQYIAEKFYASKAHPEKGLCYTGMNKTKNLPELYCRENDTSKQLEKIVSDSELASGLSVTMLIRIFATKMNNGASLDAVIVNEKPVRWIAHRGVSDTLANSGFEISAGADTASKIAEQISTPAYTAATPAPYMAAPQPAAYQTAAVPGTAPALPTPPKGYKYDEAKRLVPEGGIKP